MSEGQQQRKPMLGQSSLSGPGGTAVLKRLGGEENLLFYTLVETGVLQLSEEDPTQPPVLNRARFQHLVRTGKLFAVAVEAATTKDVTEALYTPEERTAAQREETAKRLGILAEIERSHDPEALLNREINQLMSGPVTRKHPRLR